MKNSRQLTILLGLSAMTLAVVGALYAARPYQVRMAAFVTDLSPRSFAQRRNIEKASLSFSETVLKSGETFSLNAAAGPYTPERGFMSERGYSEGRAIPTSGGGVCQVASTLFNAARTAGLEILERMPHTGPVSSVPSGDDATVVYGYADLKLRNPHPYPVKIVSRIGHDQLRVEIWGKEKPHEPL
ncbi:MAG TPA: VanW family protein [bacterium]|nr:VanW family protein [bacterium]